MKRQCGVRKAGGVYLMVATSPYGSPLRSFLFDPPKRIGAIDDLHRLGIGPRGVYPLRNNGVTHAADMIGQSHYPNVWDWIIEAEFMGISRLVSLRNHTFPFHELTRESRIIMGHQRGLIENYQDIVAEMGNFERAGFECIRMFPPQHRLHKLDEMCAGLWRHDIEGMKDVEPVDLGDERRVRGVRFLECGDVYKGFRSVTTPPVYAYAWIGSFPLGHIEVIEDPGDGLHEEAMEAARESGLEVRLVKE